MQIDDRAAGVASLASEARDWKILMTDEAQRPILYHKSDSIVCR